MTAETLYEIAHNEKYTRDERIEQMRGFLGEAVKLKTLIINGVKYDNATYNRKTHVIIIYGNDEDYKKLDADMKSSHEMIMTKIFPGEFICNSIGRITNIGAIDTDWSENAVTIELKFRATKEWEGFM